MKAGTALQRSIKDTPVRSLNSFSMKLKGDKYFRFPRNVVCFSSFSYSNEGPLEEFGMTLSHAKCQGFHVNFEQYKKYCNEVIKYSKFKHCFISKNVNMAEEYGINLRVDITPSELIGACIALRLGYEFPNTLSTYFLLREKGLSVDSAIALSPFFDAIGALATGNNTNHYLFGALSEEILFNYLKNGLRIPKGTQLVSEGNRDYRIFYTTWSAPKNVRHGEKYTTTFFDGLWSKNTIEGRFGKTNLLDIDKIVEKVKTIEKRVKESN